MSAQSSLVDARAQQAGAIEQWFTSLANLAYATGILSPNALAPFSDVQQVQIADLEPNPNTDGKE